MFVFIGFALLGPLIYCFLFICVDKNYSQEKEKENIY